MSSSNQSIAQHVREAQPLQFLPLAPATSASYPTTQNAKPNQGIRRSPSQTSVDSSASSIASPRFLKLNPVHYGERQDDYHDVAAANPQPQRFLSLAPATSATYPTAQSTRLNYAARRRSSQSSVGSIASLRFLKLNPVHYGEQQDDYHDVAVVE
ncbi:hypothetical protein GGS23DRAFT_561931 [Durotheca rogersii]|uniref:uncharacterized protein n=1 Tax=Durotheca rogersii TaxID=419775 RepID=UPI0022206296|nr:uncharacterized protein GGS23DRAFT_561931 [Durotheca rogersii]KAI5864815.1 hypothetical protein GGS23DRAFT_561931 [Durotheca rogersii]